jgi:hypothetical protein
MENVFKFTNDRYQRHNKRRQEHLATLQLPLAGLSVLEVGAGIGDHTSFFLDRGCRVTSSDARQANLDFIARRYPEVTTCLFDLESETTRLPARHDIVYCYGLLYHLGDPELGLRRMANLAHRMLLLETCVSFGADNRLNPVQEDVGDITQSVHGTGCRPTRSWVFERLQRYFPYAYATTTQPWHEEFPTDWRGAPPANSTGLHRMVFVGSRESIESPWLSLSLPDVQVRI